jgi:anaerobic selenocysteine-containing dehydrogenase
MPVQLVTGLCQIGTRHLGIDIMASKLYTSEAWLKKRYHLDKKTPEQIAKECGTSVETIYVYLAKFGLRKSKR